MLFWVVIERCIVPANTCIEKTYYRTIAEKTPTKQITCSLLQKAASKCKDCCITFIFLWFSFIAEFGDYEYDKQHQEYFEDNDLFPKVTLTLFCD